MGVRISAPSFDSPVLPLLYKSRTAVRMRIFILMRVPFNRPESDLKNILWVQKSNFSTKFNLKSIGSELACRNSIFACCCYFFLDNSFVNVFSAHLSNAMSGQRIVYKAIIVHLYNILVFSYTFTLMGLIWPRLSQNYCDVVYLQTRVKDSQIFDIVSGKLFAERFFILNSSGVFVLGSYHINSRKSAIGSCDWI